MVFAALSLGCPILAQATTHGSAELCRTLSSVKPKIVVCDDKFHPMVNECMVRMKIAPDFFVFGQQPANTRSVKDLLENFSDENDFV